MGGKALARAPNSRLESGSPSLPTLKASLPNADTRSRLHPWQGQVSGQTLSPFFGPGGALKA
jgi:hypothetical protein